MKFPLVTRRRLKAALAARDAAIAERYAAIAERDARIAALRAELRSALESFTRVVQTSGSAHLRPVVVCRTTADWKAFIASDTYRNILAADEAIFSAHQYEEEWGLIGYSLPASKSVNFRVDMLGTGRRVDDRYFPNIRERLECPVTNLNNRQRLIAGLLITETYRQFANPYDVYFMEQVTPIFSWAMKTCSNCNIVGSEFLGDAHQAGALVDGIRHENLLNLSFSDSSLDMIVSNDVMEHVPSPAVAFQEMARVMRSGSQALMTFPFHPDLEHSIIRAELDGSGVKHLLEPIYHGNPVSEAGSLVFTDFGWDIFDIAKNCGFKDMTLEIYHSIPLGHLGLQMVFRLSR